MVWTLMSGTEGARTVQEEHSISRRDCVGADDIILLQFRVKAGARARPRAIGGSGWLARWPSVLPFFPLQEFLLR
jgi:hypothetical protein